MRTLIGNIKEAVKAIVFTLISLYVAMMIPISILGVIASIQMALT